MFASCHKRSGTTPQRDVVNLEDFNTSGSKTDDVGSAAVAGGGGGGGGGGGEGGSGGGGRCGVGRLKKRKRLMRSTGHNIITTGVPDRNRKYISDLYTTLIDIQWRWNILIFLGGFIFTWVVFAVYYYFQMYLHGDFDNKNGSTPCLENVQSFTAAYLFSIETMTTIGYGYRSQTEECPGVYLAVLIQSILGAGLQFALASLVVSKTRRAKRRSETILFSNQLCICEQDSKLQLAVRVGDMRTSEIAGAHAKGFLLKKIRSSDGTMVPIRSFSLSFQSQSGRDEIFFPWPTQILHTVDEDSPLWSLCRDDFLNGQYEMIVVIDGICGSTSNSFQARKSYHPHEMKWGFRFATLNITYEKSTYVMDLSNFHHTVPASTPLCSAQDINCLRVRYTTNHPEYTSDTPPYRPGTAQRLYKKRNRGDHNSYSDETIPRDQTQYESSSTLNESGSTHPKETQRSRSMEEKRVVTTDPAISKSLERTRRCSLGDLIRFSHGMDKGNTSLGDAKNIYRHRKSITDTYLGADIQEECEDEDIAIMSVISHRSSDSWRVDVRDVFKKRRSSASKLFFGPESESSGEETMDGGVLDRSVQSNQHSLNVPPATSRSNSPRDERQLF